MSNSIVRILIALVALCVVVGIAVVFWLSGSSENGDSAIEQPTTELSQSGDVSEPFPAERFKVYILQSVDSRVELNRFEFPYADIAVAADYPSLIGVLSEIPGSLFRAGSYTIFRMADQVPVSFGRDVTAVEDGNTGLLALPNEAVEALGGPEAAFGYYFEQLSQREGGE